MKDRLSGNASSPFFEIDNGLVWITVSDWIGMKVWPAQCRATINGDERKGSLKEARKLPGDGWELISEVGAGVIITQTVIPKTPGRLRWQGMLANKGREPLVFNHTDLLTVNGVRGRDLI